MLSPMSSRVGSFVPLLLWSLAGAASVQDPDPERHALSLGGELPIELVASWEPLTDTVYGFEREQPVCRDWAPAKQRASYPTELFRPLLPPEGTAVAVGETWPVDPKHLLPFLRQFHPGATDTLHHGDFGGMPAPAGVAAPGAWACLRAVGPERAEVMVRVHAEFRLEGDGSPGRTSWLTPAQFEGRMVVDRARGSVVAFRLALPDQSANVDLNVASGGGILADIGRIPRMELAGGEPLADSLPGTREIPLEDARRSLRQRFYRFSEIDWLTLEDGLARSLESGDPLHVILLFGSLEDESC